MKKKLDLNKLEIEFPVITLEETKVLLGGSYGNGPGDCNCPSSEMPPAPYGYEWAQNSDGTWSLMEVGDADQDWQDGDYDPGNDYDGPDNGNQGDPPTTPWSSLYDHNGDGLSPWSNPNDTSLGIFTINDLDFFDTDSTQQNRVFDLLSGLIDSNSNLQDILRPFIEGVNGSQGRLDIGLHDWNSSGTFGSTEKDPSSLDSTMFFDTDWIDTELDLDHLVLTIAHESIHALLGYVETTIFDMSDNEAIDYLDTHFSDLPELRNSFFDENGNRIIGQSDHDKISLHFMDKMREIMLEHNPDVDSDWLDIHIWHGLIVEDYDENGIPLEYTGGWNDFVNNYNGVGPDPFDIQFGQASF